MDDAITRLRVALEAEIRAAKQLRRARANLGVLINEAVASGVPYGDIARVTLRLRLGKAPTVQERLREMQRLRQRRRRAVTGRHVNVHPSATQESMGPVRSSAEVRAMTEKLVKRVTTIEEFINDKPQAKDCAEDVELDEDEEEDEEDDAE